MPTVFTAYSPRWKEPTMTETPWQSCCYFIWIYFYSTCFENSFKNLYPQKQEAYLGLFFKKENKFNLCQVIHKLTCL